MFCSHMLFSRASLFIKSIRLLLVFNWRVRTDACLARRSLSAMWG
jgi:hypothetical protein